MTGIPDALVEKAAAGLMQFRWGAISGDRHDRRVRRQIAEQEAARLLEAVGLPALLERVEAAEEEAERWKNNEHLWRDMRDERDTIAARLKVAEADNERLRGICEAWKRENAMVCDRRDALAAKVADAGERIAQAIEKANRKVIDARVADDYTRPQIVDRVLTYAAQVARVALTEGEKP